MKRFLTCLLSLTLLLALASTAQADVLWEPHGNSFYNSHQNELTYEGRNYRANSTDGFITIWNAPDGSLVKGQFQNGFTLHVYWRYENWGLTSVRGDEEWIEGWVDLGKMDLLYDHIAFAQEHAEEIKPYNGEFADFTDDHATVNFYPYPGAPTVSISWYMFEHNVMENLTGTADTPSYIQSVYVDEQGLTWGFVGYMYGRLNAWFCLDNPGGVNDGTTTDFPLRDTQTPELIPPQAPVLPAKSYIPYILVGTVVIVTAGALALFFKKKKRA